VIEDAHGEESATARAAGPHVGRTADACVGRIADPAGGARGDDRRMDRASARRAGARVLIADASDAVGDAVARLLRPEPGVAAVMRAADAAEALRCAAELRPQLVLLDFALPETALGAYLEELRGAAPDARVLLLLVHPADAAAAEDAPGVAGWLLKDAGAAELRTRVRAHLDEARRDRDGEGAAGGA
jgi:DNA-binding response OmpR family regulator